MKSIKIILICLLTICFFNQSYAQKKKKQINNSSAAQVINEDQVRVQFQVEKTPDQYQIIKFDSNGLLLIYTLIDDDKIYILKYDKNLIKVYQTNITIPEDYVLHSIKNYNQDVYFLLIEDVRSNIGYTKNYKVVEYNHETKKSIEVSGAFDKKRLIIDMIPNKDGAFITNMQCLTSSQSSTRILLNCCGLGIPSLFGYLKFPYQAYLVTVNIKTKQVEDQNLEYTKQASILGGDLDDERQELNISIKNRLKKKDNHIYVTSYKINGNKTIKGKEVELELPLGKDFYSAKINTVGADEKLIFGVYGPESKYMTENASMVSNGLFFAKILGGKNVFTTTLRFDEMTSFTNSKKKTTTTSNKKEKTFSKGLVFHDIIEDEDQYILSAESYYPTYRTESYYNAQTKRYETRTVFDGYQYDAMIVIGFDKNGNKKWESHFSLPYYKTFATPKLLLVKNEIIDDNLYFTVANSLTIKFRKLDSDNTISNISVEEEVQNVDGETYLTRNYVNGGVLYANNYIVYGWEKVIKDEDEKKKKKDREEPKKMIFITKMAVYPE